MADHNLEALTPFDFESLTKSVLDRDLGLNLELYKAGRDLGVDLRHAFAGDGDLIVQCKHWPGASGAAIVRAFAKDELPKVRRLSPARYVVSTSASLGTNSKAELQATMAPYLAVSGDIYGREQIEAVLNKNDDIVRAHLRLWLNSSAVLTAVLSQPVVLRSRSYAEKIARILPRFVSTPALANAQKILRSRRVLLISGPPGIGKTTLADVLLAELMAEGIQLVKVTQNVSEALELWSESTPQVFLYDDFLGRSAIGDLLGKNEDQDILDLADRVAAADNKYFVMTTRGYMLGQARRIYEKLASPRIRMSECVLELGDLDEGARALILYNHLWATQISNDERARFADPAIHRPIIRHRNYNPRIVEQSLQRFASGDSEDLGAAELLTRNLNEPAALWRHAVENDLSEESRSLLDLFASFGGSATMAALLRSWAILYPTGSPTDRFEKALSVLEGDFLTVGGPQDSPTLSTSNPSIDDFMNSRLQTRTESLIRFAEVANEPEHLRGILRVFDSARAQAILAKRDVPTLPADLRSSLFNRATELCSRSWATNPDACVDCLTFQIQIASDPSQWVEIAASIRLFGSEIKSNGWIIGFDIDYDSFMDLVDAGGAHTQVHTPMIDSGLVRLASDALTEDTSTFELLTSAAERASSNPLLASTVELLEDRRFDRAMAEFEAWDGVDSAEFRSLVDYAGDFDDPRSVFSNYDRAVRLIDAREEERLSEVRQLPNASDASFDVTNLMMGLRGPEEAT